MGSQPRYSVRDKKTKLQIRNKMKFTVALFAAASAELTGKPDVPNSFAHQKANLEEHITFTLDRWYADCPSYGKWSSKLSDMVARLDKAFGKCGAEYEYPSERKRRDTAAEEEAELRLSKKNEAKATSQIRSVTKRITGRNLVACTRNRMRARAERIVGQMVDAKTNGDC